MKILLDTNVIIDALQSRTPWAADAQQIFLRIAVNEFIGCLTTKSVADIHYIMHHHLHDEHKTWDALQKLFELFELLSTEAEDCKKALFSPTSDYEDAIMIETAVRSAVDCIITRNDHDFARSPIKVFTPSDFLLAYPPRNESSRLQ